MTQTTANDQEDDDDGEDFVAISLHVKDFVAISLHNMTRHMTHRPNACKGGATRTPRVEREAAITARSTRGNRVAPPHTERRDDLRADRGNAIQEPTKTLTTANDEVRANRGNAIHGPAPTATTANVRRL